MAPGRLAMLQLVAPHLCVYEQHKLDSVSYFFEGVKFGEEMRGKFGKCDDLNKNGPHRVTYLNA